MLYFHITSNNNISTLSDFDKKKQLQNEPQYPRGGMKERRAGSMALRAEASFFLELLLPFVSRQKTLSPRGNERKKVNSN